MIRPLPILSALLLATAAAYGASTETSAPSVSAADIPVMTEQSAEAGINHVYDGPWEFFVGGGAAAFDCNGDRLPDIFLAGGTNPAEMFVNRSTTGGEIRFENIDTGLSERDVTRVTGAYPVDFDNDGKIDLFVMRVGENIMLKGDGDCHFHKANREFSYDGRRDWTTAFAAEFEPGNQFPTFAVGNYVDRAAPGSPWGTCTDNWLLRPAEGDKPDYTDRQVLSPGYCSLSMLFTDWNNSGTPSLRITNDRQYYRGGEEQLWRIDPGKEATLYKRSDGWRKLTIWGMGIAEGDLDGDGYPEYALTSMGDTKLQKLDREFDEQSPIYDDVAFAKGATAHRPYIGTDLKPSTGWHAEFDDFNNDGLLDLFIAKGNVEQMKDFASFDPDNMLLGQWDGKFIESGAQAGIDLPTKGRGAIITDFNMDGRLDLLVINREGRASLFRNDGRKTGERNARLGNWLEIELSQDGPNHFAVGSTISIRIGTRTITRKIEIGGGHASGKIGFVHAGLGVAERAQIRVRWPDGEWSAPYRAFANNFVVLKRGADDLTYWYPPQG
jgi:hypothetical protein